MKHWDVTKPYKNEIEITTKSLQKQSFFKKTFKLIFALSAIFFISLYLDFLFRTKINSSANRLIFATSSLPSALPSSLSSSLPKAMVDFVFAKEEPLDGEFNGRINFLFLGIPGQKNPAPYLTDTILFVSFFPENRKTYFVSIPRDLLVKVPNTEKYSRINSLYLYGLLQDPANPINFLKNKIEEITGQEIHYFAVIDLVFFENVIDSLGGVEVYLEHDLYDPNFPGDDFSFNPFFLKKGFHVLDGKTAVKYIRTRYSLYGDFDRAKRQREIVESIIGKIQNLNPIFDFKTYIDLYNNFNSHFFTNLTYSDLKRLYSFAKDLSGKNFFEYGIGIKEPTNFLKGYNNGGSYLVPKEGIENYEKIQEFFASFTP